MSNDARHENEIIRAQLKEDYAGRYIEYETESEDGSKRFEREWRIPEDVYLDGEALEDVAEAIVGHEVEQW